MHRERDMKKKSNSKKNRNMRKNSKEKENGNMKNNGADMDIIQTSLFNEEPELMKLECKNCGATLKLVDKTRANCRYCGQRFLIDEASGVLIGVTIDYGDSLETRNLVRSIRRTLILFCLIAAIVVAVIVSYNVGAGDSDNFISSFGQENEEDMN